jgi:hypothetical protein
MAKISEELKQTVAAHPHISEVHFNRLGAHYFNVHEYEGNKDDKRSGKKYGRFERQATHVSTEGTRKIYQNKNVPVDSEEIVETMTREQILATK